MVERRLMAPETNVLQKNASLWCICDGFLREEGLVHQKVDDASVNAVDPLAPGSSRKLF